MLSTYLSSWGYGIWEIVHQSFISDIFNESRCTQTSRLHGRKLPFKHCLKSSVTTVLSTDSLVVCSTIPADTICSTGQATILSDICLRTSVSLRFTNALQNQVYIRDHVRRKPCRRRFHGATCGAGSVQCIVDYAIKILEIGLGTADHGRRMIMIARELPGVYMCTRCFRSKFLNP